MAQLKNTYVRAEPTPQPSESGLYPCTMFVLVSPTQGLWRVYRSAILSDSASGGKRELAANWTMKHGNKCSYQEALAVFPNLQESEYAI